LLVLCALLGAPGAGFPKSRFHWRLATAWPKYFPVFQEGAEQFAQLVKDMSQDRLRITVLADGEAVPALQLFDAVSQRHVEMGHSAAYYWADKIPGCELMTSVPFGMTVRGKNAWLYAGNGLKLWQALYAPYQVRPFPMGNTGVQMGGWFQKRLHTIEDFRGMHMRIPGLGGEVLQQVGVTPHLLAGKDIRAAFQQGTITAAEWVGPYHDERLELFREAPYYYYPGWHEPETTLELLVNERAWQELPADLQHIITVAARAVHGTIYAQFEARNPHALQVLATQPHVKILPFPPTILSALRQTTDQVLQAKAARSPQFQRIYADYQQFRQLHDAWSAKADDIYQNGVTCGALVQYYEQHLRETLARTQLGTLEARGGAVILHLQGDLVFPTNSAALPDASRQRLAPVAQVLLAYPALGIQVDGHTDAVGAATVNQRLSERRAVAVQEELIRQGLSPAQVQARGWGASRPRTSNTTDAARQQNRRVDITLVPPRCQGE
jgi:TRAP-type mannitol/chloroaromatic compound transport system substrate-binding protein